MPFADAMHSLAAFRIITACSAVEVRRLSSCHAACEGLADPLTRTKVRALLGGKMIGTGVR
jgi:hypothetical protein